MGRYRVLESIAAHLLFAFLLILLDQDIVETSVPALFARLHVPHTALLIAAVRIPVYGLFKVIFQFFIYFYCLLCIL